MNTSERALLLVWFVVVLVVLVATDLVADNPLYALVGAAGGVALGVPVARSRALRGRPGTGLARRGVDLRRLGTTVGVHVALLVGLVLLAAVVPGLRDRFVSLAAALLTAGAATVTAGRLRRT